MSTPYNPVFSNFTWHNKETALDTPLSAANLQKLNDAIEALDRNFRNMSLSNVDNNGGQIRGVLDFMQFLQTCKLRFINDSNSNSITELNPNGLFAGVNYGSGAAHESRLYLDPSNGYVSLDVWRSGEPAQGIYVRPTQIEIYDHLILKDFADDDTLLEILQLGSQSDGISGKIIFHGYSSEDDHSSSSIYQDGNNERLILEGDTQVKNGDLYVDDNLFVKDIKPLNSNGLNLTADNKSITIETTGTGEINLNSQSGLYADVAGDIDFTTDGALTIYKKYNPSTSSNTGGNLIVEGIITVNGSDYAEMFESIEDCPEGRFVTLDGEKIRLAQPGDDYILGVTSENPAIIGDKDNPGTPVGLVGKLWVESDGSCKVNGFAISGANGIATDGGSTGYRVMAVDGNRCKILVK